MRSSGAMGSQQSGQDERNPNGAFSAKELYNLKQVYFYLCLHTTTLTSCPLDRNQFHSLFGHDRKYKPLCRALFTAIDLNADNTIDFEEFLTFVTHLKRGGAEADDSCVFDFSTPIGMALPRRWTSAALQRHARLLCGDLHGSKQPQMKMSQRTSM